MKAVLSALKKVALCSLFIVSPTLSEAIVNIDVPNSMKLRPKGSEVVLVSFKVVECFAGKDEAVTVLDREVKLVKHDACGEGFAHVLMHKNESMIAGTDKTFTNITKIPYILNQPKVHIEKGHYKVKPNMNQHQIEKNDNVSISLSKIIQGHVKATVSAYFVRVHMNEYLAHYEGDETFVNQVPVKRNRIMTGTETLKLGEAKIVSGDMWVEDIQKIKGVLPEYSRLWLEVKIK